VLIAVAVLPRHFALAASGFARSFEIEIKAMPLRDLAEDIADKHLKTIPDDLAPPVSE
jgi:hypothetical protein